MKEILVGKTEGPLHYSSRCALESLHPAAPPLRPVTPSLRCPRLHSSSFLIPAGCSLDFSFSGGHHSYLSCVLLPNFPSFSPPNFILATFFIVTSDFFIGLCPIDLFFGHQA